MSRKKKSQIAGDADSVVTSLTRPIIKSLVATLCELAPSHTAGSIVIDWEQISETDIGVSSEIRLRRISKDARTTVRNGRKKHENI